jgi:hypothetical protein
MVVRKFNKYTIYIGNGSYKVNTDSDKKWNIQSEIPNQIDSRTYKTLEEMLFLPNHLIETKR